MPDRVLTAEMVLSGKDAGVSDMLARICTSIDKVAKQASHTAEVQKLGQSLVDLDKQMAAVDRMASAQNGLVVMNERALTAAAGVDKLKAQVAGTAAPTAAMSKALAAAEAASTKATAAALRQAEAVTKAEHAVAGMSLPVDHAAATQERLARAFGDTARAAELAVTAERRAAEASKVAAAAELQHHKALERRAEIAAHHGVVGYGVQAAAGALAAHSIVHGEIDVAKAGAEIQHERVRLRALGKAITEEQARAIEKQALDLAVKYPLLTQHQLMHTSRNAVAITGSAEEAMTVAEPLAKLRVIADAQHPGQDSEEDFDALVKGLEIKGVTQHPEQFLSYMNGIAKGLNAFGDTVKPSQYYDMFKYGRQATPRLSEDFILSTAPALAQELGGSSYGKAVSGFNSAVVSGVMKHTAGKEFADLGLVDRKDLDVLKTGEVKGLKPGHSLKGAALAQADPYQWIQTYLLPALARKGITDEDGISKEIGRLFQNSTTAQLVSILATQRTKIEKDRTIQKGAKGLNSAADYARGDPFAAMTGVRNALETFAGVLTSPVMADATKGLSSLSGLIGQASERLAAFDKDHPDAAKALAVGTGTAGLAVAGTASAALLTGFGLPGASVHLEASAVALNAAAGKIGAGGLPGAAPGEPGKPTSGKSTLGGPLGFLGGIFSVAALAEYAQSIGALAMPKTADRRGVADAVEPGLGDLLFGRDTPAARALADREARLRRTERQRLMAHPLEEGLDRMRAEMIAAQPAAPTVPLPPERPAGYMGPGENGNALWRWTEVGPQIGGALPAIVPSPRSAPREMQGPPMPPRAPAFHPADDDRLTRARASDAPDRSLDGFVMGANDAAKGLGDLHDRTGVVLASFGGLQKGGDALAGGFGALGGVVGTADHELGVLALAARAASTAFAALLQAAGGAGGIGGGGITNASWGGGGSVNGDAIGGEYTDKGSFNDKAPGIMANLMRDFGLDEKGAAKILGNIGHESAGLQAFGERGGGSGIGWPQWTGARHREFLAWAAAHGLDPHSDAANYGMLKHDFQGRYSGVIAAIKRGATLEQVERMYEGARIKAYGSRHAYERAAIAAFHAHKEHPALAAPPLRHREPAGHEAPGGHAVTAKLDRVTEKLERVASAVERGGLHRLHVTADRSLKVASTYRRGSMGMTTG